MKPKNKIETETFFYVEEMINEFVFTMADKIDSEYYSKFDTRKKANNALKQAKKVKK